MSSRIYLAGPMRGIARYNFPAFFAAEARLQEQGWTVVNPARLDMESGSDLDPFAMPADHDWSSLPEGVTFKELMARDLPALLSCDAIYMMRGWQKSKGAGIEHDVARQVGMTLISELGQLVGLCGFARVGKDTAGDATGYSKAHYASALKRALYDLVGEMPKEIARPVMVAYGKAMRQVSPDHWIDAIEIDRDNDTAVCDVRYANEVKHILDQGGVVIRVHRPGFGPANDEEARSLAEIESRYPAMPEVVNDSTPEELGRKVLAIVEQHYGSVSIEVA